MENKNTWLRTSLFVDRTHWSFVLQEGVKSFIKQPAIASIVNEVLIEFNYISGENIRFAINVPQEYADTLSFEMDKFFKTFFSRASLSCKELKLPVEGLFLPCPSNSIQYGLFTQYLPSSDEPIAKVISETTIAIIDALEGTVVDEEVLTMLGFYFYCGFITLTKEMTPGDFSGLYGSDIKDSNPQSIVTPEFLSERFLENQSALIEVKECIHHYGSADYDNPGWLVDWMAVCKTTLVNNVDNHQEIFVYISNCIKLQLGLTNSMVKLVYYFVEQVYQENIVA